MNRFLKLVFVLLGPLLLLAGCGGGGGGGTQIAGIGGTGRVASGTVTAFGSIVVNDDTYNIDTASCEVDDSDRTGNCQNSLQLGMVVNVISSDFAGTTGTADSVVYDDDVEGPIAAAPIDDGTRKRFTVLGTTVVVDATTTVFDNSFAGFSYDTIALNDIVEVSGLFDANGVLNATYIEKQGVLNPGTTQVELKGTASATGGGAGIGDSFIVNGVTVTIASGADLSDIPGGLVTDGMFVEAKGTFVNAGNVSASEVEMESSAFGDDENDVSVEGYISNFVDNSNFRVAGVAVNAGSATLEPTTLQLREGLKVEVEGPIVNGTLIADEVEAEGGEIQIDASVASASPVNGTITLTLGVGPGSVTVNTDANTEFRDDTGVADPFIINDILPNDFLEIRGLDDGTGAIVAKEVRRDSTGDTIIQGPVDSTVSNTSITILGVTFLTGVGTVYEDTDDSPLIGGAATFYGTDRTGQIVKIKDDQPADTVADEVDLEN